MAKVVRICSSDQAGPAASAFNRIQARLIFRAAALPWLTRVSRSSRSSLVRLTTYFFLFIAGVFLLRINETIPRVGLAANLSINHGQGTRPWQITTTGRVGEEAGRCQPARRRPSDSSWTSA